jgi:citrate synthase
MPNVTGLEGIVAADTEISLVDGEQGLLVYRGFWARDLAVRYSFEEVAYLLWYGRLPHSLELTELKEKMKTYRRPSSETKKIMKTLPVEMELMPYLRTALSGMGTPNYSWPPLYAHGSCA